MGFERIVDADFGVERQTEEDVNVRVWGRSALQRLQSGRIVAMTVVQWPRAVDVTCLESLEVVIVGLVLPNLVDLENDLL